MCEGKGRDGTVRLRSRSGARVRSMQKWSTRFVILPSSPAEEWLSLVTAEASLRSLPYLPPHSVLSMSVDSETNTGWHGIGASLTQSVKACSPVSGKSASLKAVGLPTNCALMTHSPNDVCPKSEANEKPQGR